MKREEQIFEQAIALISPEAREGYLLGACGDDGELRRRVDELLGAFKDASEIAFLQTGERTQEMPYPSSKDSSAESPGTVIARYKLLQKIGEGGCGAVYMAEQKEPVRRRVALKVVKLGMDTRSVIARFEAERQALALMDHPNIAKVLDAGATETGRPYFVMELVRGIKITEYCDQNNLSTVQRLALFTQVCHAVQHAHQKGIIHRDIKPSNILVTLHDGVPVPKVIDFGIAKATSDQRLTDKTIFTAFEQFIGTPAYMSPEQAEMSGLDIDTRSDIYSLGVLLYELLTGKTPFDAKDLMAAGLDEMRRTIREKEPVRPSTRLTMEVVAADVSQRTAQAAASTQPADARRQPRLNELIHLLRGDLDWIVMKALEKDRTRRYETANGLAMDIQRHLNNEPIMARPPSAGYRLQKTWRRHKLAFTAGAAVCSVLLIGIVVSSWQASEARRARNAEKEQRLAAQTERDKAQTAQKEAEAAQQAERQERLRADAEKAEARRFLYAANMNLAQQAWEQNNIDRLRKLLEETQAFPDRGFEWYYWQRQTHLTLKTLRGHLQQVSSVAFSPNGQWIVTGSFDNTAKLWDADSGRQLLTLEGHTGVVIWSVAFSPDGRRIVTGGDDQTARVWNAADGRELLAFKRHTGVIWSVAFSPDGQRIVTGSDDQTAKVWDTASGRELFTLKGHSASIRSVAYSSTGQQIVTGSFDHTAKVWDTASGRELFTLKGHKDWVLSVAFSPDGRRIVTGSSDKTAKMWEAHSGLELLTLEGHTDSVRDAAFSPDGQRIVTGSLDQTAKVWEAGSGRELFTLKGHTAAIWSVAFSPDGQRIVSASGDQTIRVWEATHNRELLTLQGHNAPIWALAFSPDAKRIVTASEDHTAKVWEADYGRELLMLKGHTGSIQSAAFSPDAQRIVTGSGDQTVAIWDAASGRKLRTLKGHTGWIRSVAFSPDGQWIVTGSFDQTARVWDAGSGRERLTLKGHNGPVCSVVFSPNGRRIVSGSFDQTVKVWDADTGRELLMLTGHSGPVRSVAFTPDGGRIVSGSSDQTAKVWATSNGGELLTLKGHDAPILGVAFSPDGRRIVTASEDQTGKVWEVDSGRELLTLKGHTAPLLSVAFSPDGQRIVTGSYDQTAKIWRAARGEEVTAWLEEERAATRYLTALQREQTDEQERQRISHARDEGAINRWLILAPIPLAAGQSVTEGLETEQIHAEGQIRPKAGETTVVDGRELKWQEIGQRDYQIDFNMILERRTQQSVAYTVTYIRSETELRALRMLVGSDDAAKVYLNGKLVHKFAFARTFLADQDVVPDITLNAGLNVLVFKVVNGIFSWQGSIRFTHADGNPVTGIKLTVTPDR